MANAIELGEPVRQALAALNRGDDDACARFAQLAVGHDPCNGLARLLLGVAMSRQGRVPEALEQLEHAALLSPHDAQTHYNLAVVLHKAGLHGASMASYRRCLACNPDHPDALWNYGELLRLGEHFERALACFDRLAQLEGRKRPKAAHRMAVCCAFLDLEARAQALFREQLEADPAPDTHWEYARFLLARGRFAEAWPHYAWRFGARNCAIELDTPYAIWAGQFERHAVLLVSNEQGAGDEILFAAFLPELLRRAKRAGMRIVLLCHPGLRRLFEASFPEACVVSRKELAGQGWTSARADVRKIWHCPIGDLPRWIERPEPCAYLRPNATDISAAKVLLRDAAGPRIGIVWMTNPRSQDAHSLARNVPSAWVNERLKAWQPIQFYSLMPAEHRSAVGALADVRLCDLSWFLTDFSRTAAVMLCLDAVVSVCTSTANLAGALGIETHVLLQKHADWRWYDDAPWYSNVVTHRQVRRTDWSECFQSLRNHFDTLIASGSA
jgi:Tfp pilus assembly protein PilF